MGKIKLSNIPQTSGVYLYKNKEKKVIYVGKAVNLRNRIRSYFQKNVLYAKTAELVKNIDSYSIIKTETEFEALLLEARLIKKYQPKYNSVAKDDKHPLYIRISKDEFPKITTARREGLNHAFYFGPFPSSRTVSETLKFLRTIFPYCTEKRIGKRACFYAHLGLCRPCPNEIVKEKGEKYNVLKNKYRKNVFQIKKILMGKHKSVIISLQKEMNKLAKELRYEEAAEIKRQIMRINYLITNHPRVSAYLTNPNLYDDQRKEEVKDLGKILSIRPPFKIEGYDISNIMGKNATGSMVTFVDGEAEKSLYRRFKIKSKNTPDDVAMMGEVLQRRLNNQQWPYPDLFLIDGGESQVGQAIKTLAENKVNIPVIGLAKRFEEIIIPKKKGERLSFESVKLPRSSLALKLIQRVRDEAHRFAKKYHKILRKKSMLY